MSTTKIKKVCKCCGSENVLFDAYARWDINKQELVLLSTTEDHYCEDCDGETTVIDKEIIAETNPSESPTKLSQVAQRILGEMEIYFSTLSDSYKLRMINRVKKYIQFEVQNIALKFITTEEMQGHKAFIKKYDQDEQEAN